jgi:hypothetical protein
MFNSKEISNKITIKDNLTQTKEPKNENVFRQTIS